MANPNFTDPRTPAHEELLQQLRDLLRDDMAWVYSLLSRKDPNPSTSAAPPAKGEPAPLTRVDTRHGGLAQDVSGYSSEILQRAAAEAQYRFYLQGNPEPHRQFPPPEGSSSNTTTRLDVRDLPRSVSIPAEPARRQLAAGGQDPAPTPRFESLVEAFHFFLLTRRQDGLTAVRSALYAMRLPDALSAAAVDEIIRLLNNTGWWHQENCPALDQWLARYEAQCRSLGWSPPSSLSEIDVREAPKKIPVSKKPAVRIRFSQLDIEIDPPAPDSDPEE